MHRRLMILEVSQKQNYIFASRKLKDNIQCSLDIARVTGSEFFEETCPGDYDPRRNMVYSGGGHTVLQFDSAPAADRFARAVTTRVLREYPGMELFVRQRDYDPDRTAGENLNALSRELEIKKSLRQDSFRTFALGIEKPNPAPETGPVYDQFRLPDGWTSTAHVEQLDDRDSFLAVIHVDGNAMGRRVQQIYGQCGMDWDKCVELLDLFSRDIDCHFRQAFDEMAEDLARALEKRGWKERVLPLRKVIGAGDDICFITTGRLGLECAANFLKHLSVKMNRADRKCYTACAGVVLVHKKYPFRRAYDLSEALCRSAKKFISRYGGDFCALDFHVEFGQMKASLTQIRSDYRTDDGGRLELRPYAVTGIPAGMPRERTYAFLMDKLALLENMIAKGIIGRSKIKTLRVPFHQGEWESRLAMRMSDTEVLLQADRTDSVFFTDEEGVRRNRYFDAIELLDVTTRWQEVGR